MKLIKTILPTLALTTFLLPSAYLYTMDINRDCAGEERHKEAEDKFAQEEVDEQEHINRVLLQAAANGDVIAVQRWIKCGADINYQDMHSHNMTALMLAARAGHSKVVNALLAEHTDITIQDKYGNTALMYAALNNHAHVIEVLLHNLKQIQLINTANKDGNTALMFAAAMDHIQVVNLLLKVCPRNPKDRVDVILQNKEGDTALLLAIKNKNTTIAQLLIKASKDATYIKSNKKVGLAIDIQNKKGDTALILAARNNRLKTVKDLINANANVHIANELGYTALHESATFNRSDIVKLLLTANASANTYNTYYETPLIIASHNRCENIVSQLIAAKARVNAQNRDFSCALIEATKSGCPRTVKTLLNAKAHIAIKNNTGTDALMAAITSYPQGSQYNDIATMLLRAKADANTQNNNGLTPLMFSSTFGNNTMVNTLLYAGAHVNIPNNHGSTAWDCISIRALTQNNVRSPINCLDIITSLIFAGTNITPLPTLITQKALNAEITEIAQFTQKEKKSVEQFSVWLAEIMENTKKAGQSTEPEIELVLPVTLLHLIEQYATTPFSPLDRALKSQEQAHNLAESSEEEEKESEEKENSAHVAEASAAAAPQPNENDLVD